MQETMTKVKKILPELVETFQPSLGRLVLEIVVEDTEEYLRKKKGLPDWMVMPDSMKEGKSVPYTKGKILKMAPDSFGERYKKYYGSDGIYPKEGDIVWFVRNQSYIMDPEGQYHIIADEHVIGFNKGKDV